MKLLLLSLAILVPLAARSKPLEWTPAVVESSLRAAHAGEVYHVPPMRTRADVVPVRESIYLDAGDWRYHVTRMAPTRRVLNLHEGDRISVAAKGADLILLVRGKRYTTRILQRTHGGNSSIQPAVPR